MWSTIVPILRISRFRPLPTSLSTFHRQCRFSSSTSTYTESKATALVVGSSGALGSMISRYLSQELSMEVLGADVVELPSEWLGSWELDGFVHLPRQGSLQDLTVRMVRGVHSFLLNRTDGSRNPLHLDAIICASGGWQADPRQAAAAMKTEYDIECGAQVYTAAIQRMLHMNLDPVLAAGYVAQHYMDTGGLMVVMGATAALQPTPGMLGYGLSKAASHHVVRTLGASTGKSLESKSVRQAGAKARRNVDAMDTLTVVGILPTMIDTPANRKADPSGKFEQWTKPRDIAVEIGTWLKQPALRPHSGSLIKVHPQPDGNGATFELVR